MFDFILAIYNTFFLIFVVLINLLLAYLAIKKLVEVIFPDEDLKSGYILITGCDTGFGHDAAIEFSKRGIHVFAGCLFQESVDDFNRNEGFTGTAFIMDITKKEDIAKARKTIENKVGEKGLSCLINNAGVFDPAPIEWTTVEDMKRELDINTWGAVNTTKEMIPLLKKAGGRIVNTTSIVGRVSIGNLSAYCMSKYALEAFSDCLRHEMKFWGVSVHIIEPGVCMTALYRRVEKTWKDLWDKQPDSIRIQYGDHYVDELIAVSKKSLQMLSANPKYIVEAYLHAALSPRPRLRYVIGLDANTVFMVIASLPTVVGDWVYNLVFKPVLPAKAVMKNN